ncbi:MAG: hypothetical protein AB3N14_03010 [Flavobacteriaceae bacterium]
MKLLANLSLIQIVGTLTLIGLTFRGAEVYAQGNQTELDSIHKLVRDYSNGFVENDSRLIRNAIGQSLVMINGNFSGDLKDWQAHQFLNKAEIDEWISMMLSNAGPFENRIEIENISLRGNSGLVVTEERGKNAFRSWEEEEVAYMLGKLSGQWKIIGIFIKNIKNPE